jgi:CubicO group peptidase (beta-lactamase class C family)
VKAASDTLFELGSISKTFTATLAAYAQASGKLSLAENASQYLPALRGSSFDTVSLLNLGTHTAGGLPLQVPDAVADDAQLTAYFRQWKPSHAPGTHRNYANPSIGMLGMIAAKRLNVSFEEAVEQQLFAKLGMTQSHIHVPAERMKRYAQGYTRKDAPVRLNPGLLASEAYGVKSTAADMIRFIDANMAAPETGDRLQQAIIATHTGYFRMGEITQDLIWEQYPYPVALEKLLAGNSDTMVFDAVPATRLEPPLPPQSNVLINKTGSTNGFSAYVAFVPAKKIGIVMLANKNHPVAPRVTAAHRLLTQLVEQQAAATPN